MEAGDSGGRQSGQSSTSALDPHQRAASSLLQPYQPHDKPHRDPSTMATATILQPTSHYPSSHSSGYPTPANTGISKMISSEPGKSGGGEQESPSRQSLPSISDVLKVAEPRQFPPPGPPSMPPSSGFPSPFTSGPRGAYPDGDKHSSPQTLHHASFPPRQEPPSAYSESPRTSFPGRPPAMPPVADRRPSPPARHDLPPQHHMAEVQKVHEPRHPHNGAYAHGHPAPPPPPAGPYAHGPLPPGQHPLPGYPISPRHAAPPAPHPYDPRGPPPPPPPPPHAEEAEYANRARYDASRHFEDWGYNDALTRIAQSSRTVFNFAEAYLRIHSEQQVGPPDRLPTDRELSDMLATSDLVKRSLEQVRDLVHQNAQSERIRDGAKQPRNPYEDEDVAMYGEQMKVPQYAMGETKKRRGRAAPPGRCHSCNRIDTPEWRRGPDGARTLCNACGLHYAKLERKRQIEARQIRPKHDDRP